MTEFTINNALKEKFPSIFFGVLHISNLTVQKQDPDMENTKKQISNDLIVRYSINDAINYNNIKEYKDFYNELGLSLDNIPLVESMFHLAYFNKFPLVNTLIDSTLISTLNNGVSLSVVDFNKIKSPLEFSIAQVNEEFNIGDIEVENLEKNDIFLKDSEKVVVSMAYGCSALCDPDFNTTEALVIAFPTPNTPENTVKKALNDVAEYLSNSRIENLKIIK